MSSVKFYNPFDFIIKAAEKIKPDIKCFIQFDPTLPCPPFGETCFCDNGDIIVSVGTKLKIEDALEILAHELAHVIVGQFHNHDEKWENVFEQIRKNYEEISMKELEK